MIEDCPPEQGDSDVLAEVLAELDAVRAELLQTRLELAHAKAGLIEISVVAMKLVEAERASRILDAALGKAHAVKS